jgi:pSer/pThr/pTyr-binding forkhead associated (FHA) protein
MMTRVFNSMKEVDATAIIISTARARRRHRGTRRHSLEQIEGDGSPRVILLEGEEMIIGRGSDVQVRLTSKSVSRHHAILRVHGTDCMLYDNASHNGVFLNGIKVHSAVLRDGDAILVGDNEFIYGED